MMEVFMLVEKKKSTGEKLLKGLFLTLTILFGLGMLLGGFIWMLLAVVFGILTWIVKRSIEFEYSYFDGDIRFSKIIDKSKRKNLAHYTMDEVVIIAPSGDRSVYNYENNATNKIKNLTSNDKDAKVYTMVTKGENAQVLVKFEPDEEFLDALCVKYAYKVKR